MANHVISWVSLWSNRRTLVTLRPDDGRVIKLSMRDLAGTRIRPADDEQGFRLQIGKRRKKSWFEGAEAHRFAGAVLPRLNASGGARGTVRKAVDLIETTGHPERYLARIAEGQRFQDRKGVPGYIDKMPKPHRLALEMALHEEQERRALEGELWLLERAWREAEEIADISDKLFLPEGAEEFLRQDRNEDPESGHPGTDPRTPTRSEGE